jgi:hypothetical protein
MLHFRNVSNSDILEGSLPSASRRTTGQETAGAMPERTPLGGDAVSAVKS